MSVIGKRRRLPPLTALVAFEAAARHLSFTVAGRELHVTQSAVSQQVRLLEQQLGLALFVRKHNALQLTGEGERLSRAISLGIDTISESVSALSGERGAGIVTISATNAMAQFWLQPLTAGFRARCPEAQFIILASDEDRALSNYADVDIALLCGNERADIGEEIHFLFPEAAQPVCTPAYLARHGPFDSAQSLARANLLHLHERHWSADAIGWQPLGWAEWFRSQGVDWELHPSSLATNKVGLLMAAVLAGEGVMLGWRHMVLEMVRRNELVFAHPASVTAGRGNFMKCAKKSLSRPHVALFRDHLLTAAAAYSG